MIPSKAAKVMVLDDGDRLMGLKETAARLQTSENGLRALLKRTDKLKTIKKERYLYARKHALNEFMRWLEESGTDMMELVSIS